MPDRGRARTSRVTVPTALALERVQRGPDDAVPRAHGGGALPYGWRAGRRRLSARAIDTDPIRFAPHDLAGASMTVTTTPLAAQHGFSAPVEAWFSRTFGAATGAQRAGWPAIRRGEHTLIAAPTGAGKTLAAFLSALDDLFSAARTGELEEGVRVVYVSPLKALSNDVHKNLMLPLEGIRRVADEMGLEVAPIRAAVRTGDTPSAERQKLVKAPPHILVTTPESLYLLLTSESGRRMLAPARTVIVDEIHALAPDRRGAHLTLTLERLDALCGRPLQRIGLSATQSPIEEVARFLVGTRNVAGDGAPRCHIVDEGHRRALDLAIELPRSELEAVMPSEVWSELYGRLATLIEEHETTLVFVNTRRLAERVTQNLSERLGPEAVTSHHGSLSTKLRLDAEQRLKRGELRALVATASLELGIDIGAVDLVCQIGPTPAIATFLQRVGRSGHSVGGLPKGRIFPLSRDELAACAALVRAVRAGELDRLRIPEHPLDILSQQLVAEVASRDLGEEALFELVRGAWPYRGLEREDFDAVVRSLAEGYAVGTARRRRYLYHDVVERALRPRKGARLAALTSGGAIPDNADYAVVAEPTGVRVGTLNEDFAIESMAGDVFQLGNTSWRIQRVERGTVRVEDARGQPPSIPFWLGEAPARTRELSWSVSELRRAVEPVLEDLEEASRVIQSATGLASEGAFQVASYLATSKQALGALPTFDTFVFERFYDELGGAHLVLHAPLGGRLLRAFGLALRKRFCRSFNFELQAAASEEAVVLSVGPDTSFELADIPRFLSSKTVRDVLIQALLDAPMFQTRWRWNASRSLALLRQRGGKRVPGPLQRIEAEDLLVSVFPQQAACLENIVGDREVPDHPLVRQTVEDCLTEAMDIDGLEDVLRRMEAGEIRVVLAETPEPSPLAHEILNARPYAFLDDVPLEERRVQALFLRRSAEPRSADDVGTLDPAALRKVLDEVALSVGSPDEAHDALIWLGAVLDDDVRRPARGEPWSQHLDALVGAGRAARLERAGAPAVWVANERYTALLRMLDGAVPRPPLSPAPHPSADWDRATTLREVLRGRLELSGPLTAAALSTALGVPLADVLDALARLEAAGEVLRGHFVTSSAEAARDPAHEIQFCNRRIVARAQRLTLQRLRAEIEPVSVQTYLRFLLSWQRLSSGGLARGAASVEPVLKLLEGFEAPAAAWERDLLASRLADYAPAWLDPLFLSGQWVWGRLSPASSSAEGGVRAGSFKTAPLSLLPRAAVRSWRPSSDEAIELHDDAGRVLRALDARGACFFSDLVEHSALPPREVERALADLVATGVVTADGFQGARALLKQQKRPASPWARSSGGLEAAGRWSRLPSSAGERDDDAVERQARALLRRYGVVGRKVLERERLAAPWRDIVRVLRRLEARGEIRGGRFVASFTGEQFALPEAVETLRAVRRQDCSGELVRVSAADPLNLVGIVTPGERVPAFAQNRVLFLDGVPVAALEGGRARLLSPAADASLLDELTKPAPRVVRGAKRRRSSAA